MFEDFDSLDMYGFLDYLEESADIDIFANEIISLEEDYGIFEDQNGDLYVEDAVIESLMENYNMTEEDAIIFVMESYTEDLNSLLAEQRATAENRGAAAVDQYFQGERDKAEMDLVAAEKGLQSAKDKSTQLVSDRGVAVAGQDARHGKEQSKNIRVGAAKGAVIGAAVAGTGVAAHKAYKAHKAKKEAEARRNRGLRGKLRRLREDAIYYNEASNDPDELRNMEYQVLTRDAEETAKKARGIEASNANYEKETNQILANRELAHQGKQKNVKRASTAAGAVAGAAIVGTGVAAHKAYKAHKAKKEAEARRNRGLRGKLRRLREDYGIFEENGQLFIENEMIEAVMYDYNLYEEDAIEVIMEAYEEELGLIMENSSTSALLAHSAYEMATGKKYLREDSALNAAHAVSSQSHYYVADDADRLYRQAEMDEGDADRNLARGGKHVLGGIKQAPRSEQDKAGRGGVRFKNRVDDGDMDGEFIDSDIQKPMGAGRRIAENSDMGF